MSEEKMASKHVKKAFLPLSLSKSMMFILIYHIIYKSPFIFFQSSAMTQDHISGVVAGLNSEFSFLQTSYLNKTKEPSLSYLPIAGGKELDSCLSQGYLHEVKCNLSRI